MVPITTPISISNHPNAADTPVDLDQFIGSGKLYMAPDTESSK